MASRSAAKPKELPTVRVTFEDLKAVASGIGEKGQVAALDSNREEDVPRNHASPKSLDKTHQETRCLDKYPRGILRLPVDLRVTGSNGSNGSNEHWYSGCEGVVDITQERKAETFDPLQLSSLDARLSNLLARDIEGKQVEKIMRLQKKLRDECEMVVLEQPDKAHSSDTLQLLWRTGHYQIIEWMRNSVQNSVVFSAFLEDACQFYQYLSVTIQKRNQFTLEEYNPLTTYMQADRKTRIVILMCHKCYICLGDLARYQQQHQSTTDYGLTRKFYLKAQLLVPKNGLAYNQLAVTAVLARNKLDAVYYYMRSLAVSQPYVNAREKLLSLFEDARRRDKYFMNQQDEAKKHVIKADKKNWRQTKSHEKQRKFTDDVKEIWVFPTHSVSGDGKEVEVREKDGKKDEAQEIDILAVDAVRPLSSSECALLNKRVTARFILLHGLLFTKVAVEQFDSLLGKFLSDVQMVWNSVPSSTNWKTLVQMTAICLFSVWNVIQMDGPSRDSMIVKAKRLGLLVAKAMSSILFSLIKSSENDIIPETALCFLPALNVWVHVFMEDPKNWLYSGLDEVHSFLSLFAKLLNCLSSVYGAVYKPSSHSSVILVEDQLLSGFVPLRGVHSKKVTDASASPDSERISKLFELADLLLSTKPCLLVFNGEVYECVSDQAKNNKTETELKTGIIEGDRVEIELSEESDDVIVEEVEDTASANETTMTAEALEEMDTSVGVLIARKRELAAQVAWLQRREKRVQEIIEQQKAQRRDTIQIKPKFLVPDTNCFIGELYVIEQLVKTQAYTLAIPLVVFNELDGLAKGAEAKQTEKVMLHARNGAAFISDCFKSKRLNVCLLTSSGNCLNTAVFRMQDSSTIQGNNDDIILESCVQLNERTRSQLASCLVQEVVLLTNDRNLRVKALTKNIAVCNIQRFLTLARML
jgi:protein SMG6